MAVPYLIGIAGMMGSGKTTLARGLSKRFGWPVLANRSSAGEYLVDLFADSNRWAFETQVAFLAQRAREIAEAREQNVDAVLDRTIYEDVGIFALHFRRTGRIDKRSYKTYQSLADHYLATLPVPDLVIYVDCPIDAVRERVSGRGREVDNRYPVGHLEAISALYQRWATDFREAPFYRVDGAAHDLRKDGIADRISAEVRSLLLGDVGDGRQLQLFEPTEIVRPTPVFLEPLVAMPQARPSAGVRSPLRSGTLSAKQFPVAYIAAPFTSVATETSPAASGLFDLSAPHGRIPPGRYRTALLSVARSLGQLGADTILPHRDYNKWGRVIRQPEEVVRLCTEGVVQADFFVGLLGGSPGSHYEYGVARGMDKPCVIIQCAEIPSSFIAQGIESTPRSLVLSCGTLAEIPRLLVCQSVRHFMQHNMLV